jgi:hypothetical protein
MASSLAEAIERVKVVNDSPLQPNSDRDGHSTIDSILSVRQSSKRDKTNRETLKHGIETVFLSPATHFTQHWLSNLQQ